MKLLINAGRLKSSGVCQVARSFLKECISFPENEYHIIISPPLKNELKEIPFPDNFHFYLFDKHPLYSLFSFTPFRVLKQYHALEKEINPDCVFSIFGPMWWKSHAPCVEGFASGQFLFTESPLFARLPFSRKVKYKLLKCIFKSACRHETSWYILETETARKRFCQYFHFPEDHVFVVTNTCSEQYLHFTTSEPHELPAKEDNEFRFFFPADGIEHKNHIILNEVIPLLSQKFPDRKITFVLTVNERFLQSSLSEEAKKSILNLGRIPAERCPQIYSECDALFYPTLLECFSASYPESMQMGKPILTSNLIFATDICRDAALYFDPVNPADIAEKIVRLVNDEELQNDLIQKGKKRLNDFLSARQRTEKYLEICRTISQNRKK